MNQNSEDGRFIIVHTFMVKDLKLSGFELLVYAEIYGFSKDGMSCFYGSWKYLSELTGADRATIYRALKSLTEKGLITKEDVINENGAKRCKYYANVTRPQLQNATRCKMQPNPLQNATTPVAKCDTYYYSKKESIERERVSASPQPRSQSLDTNSTSNSEKIDGFKKPTLEEIQEYIKEKSLNIDAEDFYNYYESVGWVVGKGKLQMKSWKASVSRWAKREQQFTGQNNKNNMNCNTYATENYTDF